MKKDNVELVVGSKIYRHFYNYNEGKKWGFSATKYYGTLEHTIISIDEHTIIAKCHLSSIPTVIYLSDGDNTLDVLNKPDTKILIDDRMYGNSVTCTLYADKELSCEEFQTVLESEFSRKMKAMSVLDTSFIKSGE